MRTSELNESRSECVISNVLELLGDKWTLLIIRDLFFFNKHEYKEFLASPEGIATNVLAERLKRLVASGVIAEQPHRRNKSRKLYYLTEKGKELLPVLGAIARWGMKYFPDLRAMQDLYRRMETDPAELRQEIFARIEQWENENLTVESR